MSGARRLVVAGLLLLAAACAAQPAAQEPAIASAHPLATAAGMEILEAGGNAFDAAVAVSAALSVVEPYSSGIGGGGFFLLYTAADDSAVFIDARERAPAAASADMFVDEAGEPRLDLMSSGALSAGIPGLPAGLVEVSRRHGRLPLATVLAPAVRLAEEGFAVDARFVTITARSESALRQYGTTAFFIDGRVPETGERLRQPDLARTLRSIGEDAAESFYRGEIAMALVAGQRAAGGTWTTADLADYRVELREPLRGEYRGNRIITAPPPSSGGIVLLTTLNMLERFGQLDPGVRDHVLVESWRRAYRDRGQYVGDPAFVDVPVARLTSADHAAALAADIDLQRATPSASLPPVTTHDGGTSTSHFSVMDAAGNIAAVTQTINFRYGARVMPAGTGVVLNNEMFDFAPRSGRPDGFDLVSADVNLPAPGKRPVSSMTPTIVHGPRGTLAVGTPGGSRIISMVTLAVLAWVDGMPADAIAAEPRFHHQYLPDEVYHESGRDVDALAARGHQLRVAPRRYGNLNLVLRESATGETHAATDPRTEAPADF